MKKILLITPFAPSDEAAAEKVTKRNIELLSEFFLIDIVYFKYVYNSRYNPPNSNVKIIEEVSISLFSKILSILQYPIVSPYFTVRFNRKLARSIKSYVDKNLYDLIILDNAQSYIYGRYFPNIHKILIAHDVILQRVSRKHGWFQRLICKSSEKRMMTQPNSTVFTFSDKDIQLIALNYGIQARLTSVNIDILSINACPNKIDDYFVFFGQWKRKDNYYGLLWFLREVYPRLNKNIRFKIIGGGMRSKHREMLSYYDNIEILGFIENPYQIISEAKALISPLFSGAGVKVKVLEAFACGTPVIGGEVAFEGIPLIYSKLMVFADSKEDYANAIKTINYSLSVRRELKSFFVENYVSHQVVDYIKERLL